MGSMMNFENLVKVEAGEPLTTSLHIAEGLTMSHATVIKLIRKYKTDFEEFGLVRFEIQARLQGKHGGGDVEYALLNEGQATLLLTYMRNTDKVRLFKIALVKAFLSAKNLMADNYMGLIKQHTALCLQLKDEKQVASLSGRTLSLWKQKHKILAKSIQDVEQKMQLSLTFEC